MLRTRISCRFLLIASLLLASCSMDRAENWSDTAGIEQVIIDIDPLLLLDLQKGNYLNEYLQAERVYSEDDRALVRIKNHGKSGRDDFKKSYTLKTYAGYETKIIISNTIISTSPKDHTLCRPILAAYLFKQAGLAVSRFNPGNLFFNDSYQGVYTLTENIDQDFFLRRDLEVYSLYKAFNVSFALEDNVLPQDCFEKKLPNDDLSYADIYRLFEAAQGDLTDAAAYAELAAVLDITNCLDYLAVSFIICHSDGAGNNFYLAFNTGIDRFQFVPWDFDKTFFTPHRDLDWYRNGLFEDLISLPWARSYVTNRIAGLWDLASLNALLDDTADTIRSSWNRDEYFQLIGADLDAEVARVKSYLTAVDGMMTGF